MDNRLIIWRTQMYAWWHLCPCSRFIEIPSALCGLWWARMLTLPCDILITNPSFAVIARYGSRQFWAFWFLSYSIYALIAAFTGPPVMRILSLLAGMWLWTLISIHLAQASPWCEYWPLNTGCGIYAISAGTCCIALMLLLRILLADIYAALNRKHRIRHQGNQSDARTT